MYKQRRQREGDGWEKGDGEEKEEGSHENQDENLVVVMLYNMSC